MDEQRRQEIENNKNIRGYIIRSLVRGDRNRLMVRQITDGLRASDMILSPDIGRHLEYLKDKGYIEFTNDSVTAYTAYRNEAVIKLTDKGIDLAEYTITDAGVNV